MIDTEPSQSLAQKVLASGKPFIFFHTWTVNEAILQRAIAEGKSMDLDISVDEEGDPYLGHSPEYHRKSGEPYFDSMPLWKAVDLISQSDIMVLVDCKHHDAWPVIENVVEKIGPERCRVDSFVSELRFGHSRGEGEPDFLTEWSAIGRLRLLKAKYPSVTTAACAKWPPRDLLVSDRHERLVEYIRDLLKMNHVDLVCLSIPYETITDEWLRYFRAADIMPSIEVDKIDTSKLSGVYIGETDHLERASTITQL